MPQEIISMRQRIIEEASNLFVKRGVNGISMREIAEACYISKAALYYHFVDKEALVLAVLSGYLDDMESIFMRCQAIGGSPSRQLEGVVRSIFAEPPHRRSIIRMASQEMVHLTPQHREELARIYHEKFIGQFAALIGAGIAEGEFRQAAPLTVTWLLLGMMYPFFYPSADRTQADEDAAVDLILSVFLEGIKSNG